MQSQQMTPAQKQEKFISLVNQVVSGLNAAQQRNKFTIEEAHELFGFIITMKKTIEEKKLDKNFIDLLNKLVGGIQLAQKRGSYSLQEAHSLYMTITSIQQIVKSSSQKPVHVPNVQKKKLNTIKEEDIMEL